MGSRILLISLNQYDFPYPVFPLGAAQVQAALIRAGHTVHLVDLKVNPQPVKDLVASMQPDYVGISLRNIDDALIQKRETFFGPLVSLVEELRAHTSAPVILGGSGFSIFPEELLEQSGADYGIQGEGEGQLTALIDLLNEKRDVAQLSGLVHRREGVVHCNPRTGVECAGEIPGPALPPEITRFYLERSSMLNVQTQRGCALKCCYCTYPLLEGRTYRQRPPEAVAEDLARMEAQGAKYVFIVDSVFNTSHSHVVGVCEAILRRGIQLKWCCFLRPKRLTRDLMGLMARAGLTHVEFGSDSFSDPVLKAYGKGLTFEDILESSEAALATNTDYAHFLILGGPGETANTVEQTISNARRLTNATLMARVGMRVYPGTPLFDQLKGAAPAASLPPLLAPFYYIAPSLTQEWLLERLKRASEEMPNWIYDDPPPEYARLAERLRAKGVVGPLWCYFAMMQRLGGLVRSA